MATINVDDAYILNETGAEVDKTTGIPFKNESLTEAEAAQARANIRAGGSNDNLLDNAYFVGGGSQLGDGVFPINQRGQASYSGYGNHFDRWRGETNYPSITLAADGVKFCSTTLGQWGTMVQYLAKECVIAGKTVTISAIIDGTLASTTYSIPASGGYDLPPATVGDIAFNLYSPNGTDIQFRFYTTTTTAHTIAAAKLEEGTVSTLANDLPHDFGEELRKCKSYLRYVSLKRLPVFCDANYLVAMTTLEGIEMRATPTPTLVSAGYIFNPATSNTSVPTAVSILAFEYNTPTIQLSIPAAFNGFCIAVDSAICLSAEL